MSFFSTTECSNPASPLSLRPPLSLPPLRSPLFLSLARICRLGAHLEGASLSMPMPSALQVWRSAEPADRFAELPILPSGLQLLLEQENSPESLFFAMPSRLASPLELLLAGRGMEVRSQQLGSPGVGADRISALPDELLLLVLARLPCVGAAARTCVLARRWRGLWSHLRLRLRRVILRDVPFPSLEAALACVSGPPHAVPFLEIHVPKRKRHRSLPQQRWLDAAGANSLLLAAARFEPEELVFAVESVLIYGCIDLPCFHRTTSITLDMASFLHLPAGVEFPMLETLSLSRCIADLAAFVPYCPRLRTLRLRGICCQDAELRVNSASLQQLLVEREQTLTARVNIVAPMLKQLTMSFNTLEASISILAPMVEKVSWRCSYTEERPIVIVNWRLKKLRLHTAEGQGQHPSLHIHACFSSFLFHDEAANFTQEIEKHMIAAFSVLELHLETKGHVYGAFVFHVLEINRIRCAIQRLKVDLPRSVKEEEGCLPHCPCDSPNWKSRTISLTALEEVEISGFDAKDHDFDLLKLILRCAPMLKRMIMKLSKEASASNDGCTKIYNIFTAYFSVQCDVYLSSGEYMFGMHD